MYFPISSNTSFLMISPNLPCWPPFLLTRAKIALGFKQRSNVRDVSIEHLHVCIGQNQRIKSILSSSLERFLINEFTLFLSCSNHVHRQILLSHGTRPLHFDEQIFRGKCLVRGVNLSWTRFVFISNLCVLFLHSRIKVIFKKRVVKKYLLSRV